MGGCSGDEREYVPSALTLALVGRTGNGKSATGNSIIGSNEFVSKLKSGGVTMTSELKTTTLEDGRMLNVIDTPGLFDSTADSKFIAKEIVSCVNKATDGIDGVLVVFSVFSRFSEEEKAVMSCLVTLFGTKIYEYVIIVFTGGDQLEEGGQSLNDFLSDCPEALKEILSLCGNRCVLFDNRTKDHTKKVKQVQLLLSYVKEVLEKNGGRPYTNEIFTEFKKQNMEFEELVEKLQNVNLNKQLTNLEMLVLLEQLRERQFDRIMKVYESKVMEIKSTLEKLLEGEQAKREKAEESNKEKQKEFQDEINRLKEELENAKNAKSWCGIM